MNLRIAKKIMKAAGTPDAKRYTDHQFGKAVQRYRKTLSCKIENAFWQEMMDQIHKKAADSGLLLIEEETVLGVEGEAFKLGNRTINIIPDPNFTPKD